MSEFSDRLTVIIDTKTAGAVAALRALQPWNRPDPNPFPRIRVFPWWR